MSGSTLTCPVGVVAAGADATVTVKATVDPGTIGALTNTATVGAGTADPDEENNAAAFTTTVGRSADISVTKDFLGTAAVPGAGVTWHAIVRNAGPSTATGVEFADTLNPAVTGITATFGPAQTACAVTGQQVTCPLGSIEPGTVAMVTISGTLASSYGGDTLANTASVGSPDDSTPDNNTSTSTTAVTPAADLSIGKALTSGEPVAGAAGQYRLEVNNLGPSDANGVVITDQLPATFAGATVALTGGTGTCTVENGALTCSIASVPVGTVPVVTIDGTFTQSTGETVANTGRVSADTADPVSTNNSSTATGDLHEEADLQVSKTGPATVIAGRQISWQITVHNAGPSDARGVTVSDTLPAGVTGATATIGGVSCGIPANCSVGRINAGADVVITVAGTVSPSLLAGSITNVVSASGETPDPDGRNNSASQTTTVTAAATLAVRKSVTPDPLIPGRNATYTVTVTNNGPSDAQASVLTDPLPDGLSVRGTGPTADQGTCDMVGRSAACTLGVVAAGSTVTVAIPVAVAPGFTGTSITNSATVSSPTPEPDGDPSGRTGTSTTDVTARADLTLTKSGPQSVVAGEGMSWTLTLANSGPSVAQNVVITDVVPAAVTGLAASATHGSCDITNNTLTCTIGVLAPGDSARVTLFVTGTVDPAFTGELITNTARALSPTPEPSGNDPDDGRIAQARTTVTQQADLVVTKVPTAASFVAGSAASWTITVRNLGPSAATGVTVVDTLPADLQDPRFADGTGAELDCPSGVCDIGTLAPGASVVIVVGGTVGSDTTADTITNAVAVSSDTPDPVTGNNRVTSEVPLVTQTHLVLDKSGPATVVAGTRAQWLISVSNDDGPSTARGVSVSDALPAGISDIALTGSPGVTCPDDPAADAVVTCTLPDLPVGGPPATITVTATLDAGYLGSTLVNSATATSDTPLADPDDATDQLTSQVQTRADLAITKTGPAEAVTAGTTIRWTVTVHNDGPSVARSVTVDDPAPSGVTGMTGTWSGGTCDSPCELGDLAPDADVEVTYAATVRPGYAEPTLANIATVRSDTTDPVGVNDVATSNTDITTAADLSLVKTVSPNPLIPGGAVTYTLTVHNAGPSDAVGVTLTDALPAGLTGVSASSTAGSCSTSSGVLTCALNAVAAGEDVIVTVHATLSADVDPGTVTNTASVAANTHDPDTSNNSSSASAKTAPADLSVKKTASAVSVLPGDPLVYTIVSANAGPGPARNTVVTDRIPDGTHLVGFTTTQGTCSAAGQVVTCLIGTVPAGSKATVVVTAEVDADRLAPLVNQAAVLSPDDADPSDNISEVTTEVTAVADLELTKKVTSGSVVAGGEVSWQVWVHNAGPAAAPSVVLTDPVPAAVTGLTATAGCTIARGVVTCQVGTLGAGKSFTAIISGTLDPAFRGSLTNRASVISTLPDPDPDNNTATVTSKVGVDSDLTVAKEADVDTVAAGGQVSYTITVVQHGASTSAPVTLTENLPSGATVEEIDASQGSYSAADRIWAVGTVAPGSPATLVLRVRLDTAGQATNMVDLTEKGSSATIDARAVVDVTVPVDPPPPPPAPLPGTGFPAERLTVIGLLLLLGGALSVVIGRRRRPTATS